MKHSTFVALMFALAGCASSSYPDSKMANSVGQWTYKDAVGRFGNPDSRQVLKDGVIVAKWVTVRPSIYKLEEYDSKTSKYLVAPPTPFKETMTLAFNQHGILKSWRTETDDPQVIPQVRSSE